MKIIDVIKFLEECYPPALASDFDHGKIGLSVGSANMKLTNALMALDVTLEVVEEAVQQNCNLIITHHPFLFEPITKIDYETPRAKILRMLFEHNISLYSMHTNLDVGLDGVNDTLAGLLELTDVISSATKDNFLRYGKLPSQTLEQLIEHVKRVFELDGVKYTGSLDRIIQEVGVVGGSGGTIEEVDRSVQLGLDCLITGEIKLHVAQYAHSVGLALIEVAHGVEKHVLVPLCKTLKNRFNGKFEVILSKIETDPLKFA